MADRLDSAFTVSLVRRAVPVPIHSTHQSGSFINVEHEGTVHRVALKRVASAHRFTLRVRSSRRDVVLTMPLRGSVKAAAAFAHRYAAWIAQRIARLEPAVPYADGAELPFRGVLHRLVYRPGLRRRVWIEAPVNDDLPSICVGCPDLGFGPAVAAFLRREAASDLEGAVRHLASAVERSVGSIRLKDTRSRWGSCSVQGTLSFSWRLIFAPPFVLYYLAAHEVAHLVHMNHSDAFWAVTYRLAPRTDEAEAWLKRNGAGLHRFGS